MLTGNRAAKAALQTLAILQTVMLTALYAGIAPHPPAMTPLFGIAPLIAASLSAVFAALTFGAIATRTGTLLSVLAALTGLISFGPQKYADPQFPLIWPAVIAGQIAIVVLLVTAARRLRADPPRQPTLFQKIDVPQ